MDRIKSDAEDESNGAAGAARDENLKAEESKKLIVSLRQAAEKIDLAEFLKEPQDFPDLQLLSFYFYLETKFSEVSFDWVWVEMFQESPLSLSKLIDVPLSHIPKSFYKASVNWIRRHTIKNLSKFVSWAFERILSDLAAQQGGDKGEKKGCAAEFVALAMVLRGRPDALTNILPMLRGRPRYQGEDKLPVTVWMMAQASQGDLSAGLYSWAHNLLPLVGNKKCRCSPQSTDLILQLVENILSTPESQNKLVNGVVWEGEWVIPPSSYEILVRLTFPASSARVEATKRFEAIYPLLEEVALGAVDSATGSKAMMQIFTFSLKLAGEGNPVLAMEATDIAIWCLTANLHYFKHWDNLYMENLEGSVALLKMLVDEWEDHSLELTSSLRHTFTINQTMVRLMLKNEKGIIEGGANCSLYEEADKYCKLISKRVSPGSGGLEMTLIIVAVVIAAAVAAALVMSYQKA